MLPISKAVLLIGASGYIGRHVNKALRESGYKVFCVNRPKNNSLGGQEVGVLEKEFLVDWNNTSSVNQFKKVCPVFDIVISCIASRSGGIKDSWDVEYSANKNILKLAKSQKVKQFILLSAICVQKPKLTFQKAKIAFETELINSSIPFTVIRPTAFFKSISGQVSRLKLGKKFIVFGNGKQTMCKPIAESDLAAFICSSIGNPDMINCTLPIGGPGPAITPKQQGEILFRLMGKKPRFFCLPASIFVVVRIIIRPLCLLFPSLMDKCEFMKIAHYYATESMLLWNEKLGVYDSNATPEYGNIKIEDFYKDIIMRGEDGQDMGANKLF